MAVPVSSATAIYGARASAAVGSSAAPRPLAKTKLAIAAVLRHTVGKRERQHDAGGRLLVTRHAGFIIGRHLGRPALRLTARGHGTLRAVAAEAIEPDIEIDMIAAEPTLGQDGRDIGGGVGLHRDDANPRSSAPAAAAMPAPASYALRR